MPRGNQATTLKRAKAQYKKSGPTAITPTEQRRLERGVELDRRAQTVKERDKRRKAAERARAEREEKEREARRQLGIGLATQLVGYSLSQKGMKGGMEGWLGVGGAGGGEGGKKRKREDEVEEKENRRVEEGGGEQEELGEGSAGVGRERGQLDDSFGSNMSLDEVVLGQLDGSSEMLAAVPEETEDKDVSTQLPALPALPAETKDAVSTKLNISADDSKTPPTKRAKTGRSPENDWAQFIDGNTQILHEISQPSPPPKVLEDPLRALPPMSTQDFELNSDDFLKTGLPKTANPALSSKDGVIIRDFAYSDTSNGSSFTLEAPGAPALPRKSRTEQSMRRSFGRKPTIATPSPKMTATCSNFTAAQCSFTTDYHQYGFSTQILQEAIDDGDGDTEDEDEEVYSQALQDSKIPDHVLMPPPPITLSPKVFKPPALTRTSNSLFSGKGGLQIFGLSTQMLNDAISTEDDVSTDEDEDDALFSIPLARPQPPPAAVEKQEVTIPSITQTTKQSSSTFRDFGLSTQVLQEAALDEIDFTDDEDTQGS